MLDSEEPNVEVFAELSAGQRDGCGAPGGKVQAIKYLNSRSGLGSSCIPCKCCQCGYCKDRNTYDYGGIDLKLCPRRGSPILVISTTSVIAKDLAGGCQREK